MLRRIIAALLAGAVLAGCAAQPPQGQRPDPHPGVEHCSDTDKPGHQRVCIEFTTYCDGLGTPFPLTVDIVGVGLDLQKRRLRDPATGEESDMALHLVDETRMTDDGSQALLVVAFDYPMAIPPTLLMIAALTGSTATRGCDMFVALSSPQTRTHPFGQGLFSSGADDMDYFLAEQDFIPMTAKLVLEVPYLLRPE